MSIVFVVSAPSGTGKSTLVNGLLERDSALDFSVSVTTRPPRSSEVDGKAYQFVGKRQFRQMREQGELLEWAEVFGNYYGTPRAAMERARARGRDLVLDIDVQGASSLIEILPNAVTIFILPPSSRVLEQRLTERSSDTRSVIARRLGEAAREVGNFRSYDYVIVNRTIEDSVDRLYSIVKAERSRRMRMEPGIEPILDSFGVGPDPRMEGDQ